MVQGGKAFIEREIGISRERERERRWKLQFQLWSHKKLVQLKKKNNEGAKITCCDLRYENSLIVDHLLVGPT